MEYVNPVQQLFDFLPYGTTLSKSLLYFLGTAVLAFLIAPAIIDTLYDLKIRRNGKGDQATLMDENKGKIGTPIMGGLIVIISVLIITLLFNWERNFTWLPIGAFVLSSCIGGIDDLLNIFGGTRKAPKPFRLHLKLARVHKSPLKRFFYTVTLPWAALVRFFKVLGSVSKKGLQPHEKILVQTFIGTTVALWIYNKVGWDSIWIPYFLNIGWISTLIDALPGVSVNAETSSIVIGWLMVPFIVLTILTVTNAVNITDGMDGLAGGLLLSSFIGYAIIAYNFSLLALRPEFAGRGYEDYRHITYLCATVAGALVAYLYFNVKPARVQMGDVGSLALGTLLSVIAIVLHREFTLLFIAGMFLIDGIASTLLQIFYIKFKGRKLLKMSPLHYHFELNGWPEEKVVMRFWIWGGMLVAFGIWIAGV
jgi:phospho-N-acetylmuramoyl-pentapeptide-transferase